MKKNHFMHKVLSLALIVTMITCCTACGNKDENNNTTATDGTMNNTTTTDGTTDNTLTTDDAMNNTAESNFTNGSEMSTEQITDGTEGIITDTIDGVMNDVKHP